MLLLQQIENIMLGARDGLRKPFVAKRLIMKRHSPSNLIPRNNWDYSLKTLFTALGGACNSSTRAPNAERVFQGRPIWTKSGRTSLYAILKSLGLPAGAKVGVPLFCCSVVFDVIRHAGLSPRFLDSNISDCNMSVEDLRNKRADLSSVVAVHMFGKPCDMDAIVADANPLPVIEDCAQSLFSTYKGKPTGVLSTASFFSFRCGKYISAGEGSAIFCKEVDLQSKIEETVNSFHSWSLFRMFTDSLLMFVKATLYNRPWYGLVGYPVGMRLDRKLNLTAKEGFETGKIASSHLAVIDARIAGFRDKINIQREHALKLLDAVTPGKFFLPSEDDGCFSNWYQFALRFPNTHQRDAMADHLLSEGIDSARYLDNIVDEARTHYGYTGDCPNAELLSKTVLLVPIHYKLCASDIEHIGDSINEGSQIL